MSLIDKFKERLFDEQVEPGQLPSWIDRLQEASYTGADGTEITFDYGDIQTLYTKKVSLFENIVGSGGYVQDNGVGTTRFPCIWYFHGDQHDKQAQTAIKAILEKGESVLNHPLWGAVNVVCSGSIQHISNLMTEANQTTIITEFLETTGLLFADVPAFPQLLESFQEAAAESFAEKVQLDDPADIQNVKTDVVSQVGNITNTLDAISSGVADVQTEMDDIGDSIIRTIDAAVGQPLTIARQIQNLINTPARIAALARAKLDAYRNLAEDIFGRDIIPSGYDYEFENQFQLGLIIAGAAVGAAADGIVDVEFDKRQDIVSAIIELTELAEAYKEWSDEGYGVIADDDFITTETSADWLGLNTLVNNTVEQLLRLSFNARVEVKQVLTKERGLAELCYELQGSGKPEALLSFILANNLSIQECVLIPKGTEIVYYV